MNRLFLIASAVIVLAAALSGCASDPAPTPAPLPATLAPAAAPATATTPPPSATPAPTETLLPPTATEAEAPAAEAAPFELTSAAFEAEAAIPARFACHGENLSPPLAWSEPPPGTQSYALIFNDPDAVGVAGFVWDHWVLYGLPAASRSLPEGVPAGDEGPDGSLQGKNNSNVTGYSGPCPPSGQTHRYVFTLYALDAAPGLEAGATSAALLEEMDGHILAQAELAGPYTSP